MIRWLRPVLSKTRAPTVRMASTYAGSDLKVHSISNLYTMDPEAGDRSSLGRIEDGAVVFKDRKLVYVGPSAGAPSAVDEVDGSGMIGLPGLVDSHTHTVWAGSRSHEFGRRLAGASYSEILEAGGGILSTVKNTREASLEDLSRICRERVSHMVEHGVTTVEIKSGYGLDPATERKMLQAAKSCNDLLRVVTTFLGAHTIPADYRDRRDAYVDQVVNEQLPSIAELANAVDVYVDRGAFTLAEGKRILQAGKDLGLNVKAHAEQVEYTGIAEAAADMGAVSVDHLERIDARGIAAMAANKTVAVLLPGAQLYLRDTPPPVKELREAGVRMAVATDLNPGTSPVHDLWACATLACLIQGLTMEEALLGITRYGGLALGRPDLGWLGKGSAGDFILVAPPPGEPPIMESLLQHLYGHRPAVVVRCE